MEQFLTFFEEHIEIGPIFNFMWKVTNSIMGNNFNIGQLFIDFGHFLHKPSSHPEHNVKLTAIVMDPVDFKVIEGAGCLKGQLWVG